MRKFVFIIIITFILSSCTNVSLKEPTIYYKLPEVHRTSLNTNLEGNNFLYPIKENELYGFININGETVIEPKFARYSTINKGYYIAFTTAYTTDENYTAGFNDPTNGTYLISPNNNVIKISDKNVYIYITDSGKYGMIYDELYENNQVINKNYIFDLISQKEIAKSEANSEIITAYDDFYIVKNQDLYYMVNYNREILSLGYDSFTGIIDNISFFKNNDTMYWVDKNGNSFFKYDNCNYAMPFYQGVAAVITSNENLEFIDKDKNILNTYANTGTVYMENNFYFSNTQNGEKIFDINGNRKLSESYLGKILYYEPSSNFITSYNEATSDFYIFEKDASIKETFRIPEGYSNPSLIYDYIKLEKNLLYGLGLVKNGKMEWVLEPKYTSIYADNAYITVFVNSTSSYGLFDLQNKKFILDPNYKNIYVHDKNMIYVESAYFNGYVHSNGEFVYIKSNYGFGDD